MTKRTRTQQDQVHWQAQRDERMSDLLQQLEAAVQAIQTSDDFTCCLDVGDFLVGRGSMPHVAGD